MEINVKNESLQVCSVVCNMKNDFTTECDIIVPDTKPDIAKILQMSAKAKITGCETQNDRVIVSGNVSLNIIYLADNEEKSVKSINASAAFSNLFQNREIRENMLTAAEVDVSEINCNLANCRKLTAKAVLCGNVQVYSCEEKEYASEIEGAKTKKQSVLSTVICSHAESSVTIADSFEIPQGKMSISEILKTDAEVNDSDIKIIDDKAIVKGTISVTTLFTTEAGIDFIETELPFAQVIDADGIRNDMNVEYKVKINDINVNVMQDINGEMRVIDVSAELFFRLFARRTLQVNCVTDAYLPHGAIECKKEKIKISGVENTLHNEVNFKETVILPDNIAPVDTIYEIIARPYAESCKIEGDKLKINGYTEIYILYLSRDNSSPVYSYKENIDFSVVTDAPDCSLDVDAYCETRGVSYVLNGDRSIEVRGSIKIKTGCVRTVETNIIYGAEIKEYTPSKRPSIIISYVSDNRSLWDIAKEYNIDEMDILRANAIENEDDIFSGTALVIPK